MDLDVLHVKLVELIYTEQCVSIIIIRVSELLDI
jgi:hypothetical protein